MTDQQLVIDNFADKLKAFTHAVNGKFTSEADFVIANTEIPTDTFNTLLPKASHIKNGGEIRQVMDDFYSKGYPISTWIDTQYLSADWKQLMQEYNLNVSEYNVMMKLENTTDVAQSVSHQLNIQPVNNSEALLAYIEVFLGLFEGTSEKEVLESYFEKFSQKRLGSEVQMFVGYAEGFAVTTSLLIESKDSYGIYDVMTKETHRGRGYGSEMFQFLLGQTKDKQKPVVLQASDDGINIYKRFGFTNIGKMAVFE